MVGEAPRGRGFFCLRRGMVPSALRARRDVLEAESGTHGPRQGFGGRLVGAAAREREDVRGGREPVRNSIGESKIRGCVIYALALARDRPRSRP